jgi:hypothetical protein
MEKRAELLRNPERYTMSAVQGFFDRHFNKSTIQGLLYGNIYQK